MMSRQQISDEELVERRILNLNAIATAFGSGALAGLGLWVATMILVLQGGPYMGQHLGLLSQYLPGYSVSFVGAFVGLVYGFLLGGAAGHLVAVIYNRLAR